MRAATLFDATRGTRIVTAFRSVLHGTCLLDGNHLLGQFRSARNARLRPAGRAGRNHSATGRGLIEFRGEAATKLRAWSVMGSAVFTPVFASRSIH